MEIQLLPAISLLPIVSVLIAPEEMLARALNDNPHLQQFSILFIAHPLGHPRSRWTASSSWSWT